jgi:Right handed beta helix region
LLRRPFAESAGCRPCVWPANIIRQSKEFSMISKNLASIGVAATLVAVLPAVSAQAQAPRTFVSAAGSDSNPCSFAAPCRHFQAAVNATSAGGEVDALDPAGYGPIIISQAITIEGQGWSYIAPPVGGNGITINAVSGNVIVRGVSINGVGISGTTSGIQFNSGDSLNVQNSVIRNFISDGITLNAPASVSVSDMIVSSNDNRGIAFQPSGAATLTVERVQLIGNSIGVVIAGDNAPPGAVVAGTLADCVVSGNSDGIFGRGLSNTANPTVTIVNGKIVNNNVGLISSDSTVNLAQSTISNNKNGGFVIEANGVIKSFDNNFITDTTNQGTLTSIAQR